MTSTETPEIKYTEDHSYDGHRIRLECFFGGRWGYVVNGCIRGIETYPASMDAMSEAVDLLIMLKYSEPGMTSERFATYLAARDARLEPGYS
jgi:hypothetical protein